jgi:polar amino acid transport system substrate-binding protein
MVSPIKQCFGHKVLDNKAEQRRCIMRSNPDALRTMTCSLILIGLLLFSPLAAFSQDDDLTSRELVVGVMEAPPAYIKTADNRWEGFCVEVWQAVAQNLGLSFEFREFGSIEPLLDALEKKEIDVIPSLAVQDRLESAMDFSQSYLKSGLAIAVPAEDVDYRWIKVIESVFSPHILKAIVLLFLMSLIFGIIVWLFERQRNSEMFGDGYVKGIGQGIWWAMVTMTTVGYGDKAPKTMGGRIFALIWMIFSIIFIASFTASITSQLTISGLRGKVRGFNDLYHAHVGSIAESSGFDFLTRKGIAVIPFKTVQDGLSAVTDHKIDAFVHDEKILSYLSKTTFPGRVQVLEGTFNEYFVSIALPPKSPLRKPINKALLQFMKTERWIELLNRYIK